MGACCRNVLRKRIARACSRSMLWNEARSCVTAFNVIVMFCYQIRCALDSTMVYNYNLYSSAQKFTIKSFRFVRDNSLLIYIHCQLVACHRSSSNSRCKQGCIQSVAARKRRDTQQYKDTSGKYALSTGPVQIKTSETSNQGALYKLNLIFVLRDHAQ